MGRLSSARFWPNCFSMPPFRMADPGGRRGQPGAIDIDGQIRAAARKHVRLHRHQQLPGGVRELAEDRLTADDDDLAFSRDWRRRLGLCAQARCDSYSRRIASLASSGRIPQKGLDWRRRQASSSARVRSCRISSKEDRSSISRHSSKAAGTLGSRWAIQRARVVLARLRSSGLERIISATAWSIARLRRSSHWCVRRGPLYGQANFVGLLFRMSLRSIF